MPPISFRPPEKLYREIMELVPDGEKLSRTVIELIEIGIATKKNHGIKDTIKLKEFELEKLKQMKKIQDLEFKNSLAAKNAEIDFYKEIQRKKAEKEKSKIKSKEENERQHADQNKKEETMQRERKKRDEYMAQKKHKEQKEIERLENERLEKIKAILSKYPAIKDRLDTYSLIRCDREVIDLMIELKELEGKVILGTDDFKFYLKNKEKSEEKNTQ